MSEPSYEISVSPDGKTATLTTNDTGDASQTITVMTERLPHVMLLLSQAAADATQKQTGQRAFHILQIEQWRVMPHADGSSALLSFRIPGGMETNYRFDKTGIPQLIASLQRVLAEPSTPTSKN